MFKREIYLTSRFAYFTENKGFILIKGKAVFYGLQLEASYTS